MKMNIQEGILMAYMKKNQDCKRGIEMSHAKRIRKQKMKRRRPFGRSKREHKLCQ